MGQGSRSGAACGARLPARHGSVCRFVCQGSPSGVTKYVRICTGSSPTTWSCMTTPGFTDAPCPTPSCIFLPSFVLSSTLPFRTENDSVPPCEGAEVRSPVGVDEPGDVVVRDPRLLRLLDLDERGVRDAPKGLRGRDLAELLELPDPNVFGDREWRRALARAKERVVRRAPRARGSKK